MPWGIDRGEPLSETELQKARRHLHDARERLTRQKHIVAKMESVGGSRSVELAIELLEALRTSVALAEYHVARLDGGRPKGWS